VDRTATDDASSDVVVADPPMATGARRGNGDQDTLYRRPPAQAPDAVDSSWFADAAIPAPTTAAPPNFGPTPPVGPEPGRTSFGFSSGPISPVRSSAAPGTPAPAPLNRSGGLAASSAPAQPRELTAAAPVPPPTAPLDPLPTRSAAAPSPVAGAPAWRPGDTGSWQAGESVPVADAPAWRPSDTGSWQTGESVPVADAPVWRPTDTGSWQTGESPAWRSDTGAQAGRESRPAAEPAAPPRVPESLPPRQPRIVTFGIAMLSGIVLLAGTVIGVVYFSGSDDSLDSVLKLGATGSESRVASAPLDNRSEASFELLAGANVVNLRIGELGDDLYRISTPEDAGIRPSPVVRDDAVQLQVNRDGDGTGGEIDVVLAAKVTWSLRFAGYVQEEHVDLTDGKVSTIDMVGATKHAELLLPKPSGTVPIKVAGAVEGLTVQSPAGSPVRIRVGGGAQTVVAGTRTLRDVAPGSTLTPKDWATDHRYDVNTASRVTALTVETVEK
jgi:hypothetical protein